MKSALLHNQEPGRICQIVDAGSEFPVHPNFSWVSVPDDTTETDKWDVENETVIKYNLLEDPVFISQGYKLARGIAYGTIGDQLDMLYKEIVATGSIAADGPWATHIANVKGTIPKDDPAAVVAWNEAYVQQSSGNGQP